MILDEPSNGLDPKGMSEMRALLRTLGQGNRTVLLSSHLMGEVEQVCDRVGVIREGRLVAEGTVAEIRGRGGLLLRAEPLRETAMIAEKLSGVAAVEVRDDGLIRLDADPDRAAEISHKLFKAGIQVAEIRPERRSLEDVFLELTGEEGRR